MNLDDMRLPDGNGGWVDGNGNRGKVNEDGSIHSPYHPQNTRATLEVRHISLQDIVKGDVLEQMDHKSVKMLLQKIAGNMIPLVNGNDTVKEFEAVHKKQQDHDLNYLEKLRKIHRRTNWSNIFFGVTFLMLSIVQFIHSLK